MRLMVLGLVIAAAAVLGGCGATETLDASKELPVACLAKPDPGPCRAAKTRFYYDYRDNRCKPFAYGGCQGRVPFETLDECRSFCGASR